MNTIVRTISLVILFVAASGCELLESTDDTREPVRQLTADEQAVVTADNQFGLNLFRSVSADEPDDNTFISPLSVSMALGMTLNGAADSTYRAMVEALEKEGLTQETINESYRSLIDLLRGLDPAVAFQIANSIWHREGFPVEQDFLDVNRTYFDAEVRGLDFADPSAVDVINGWVDEATRGKIETIIERIPPLTVMYLINAIHFQGDWTYPFDPEDTDDAPFHNADGTTTDVPLMRQTAALPYVGTDSYQAVDLPYGDSLYSMTVVLPHEESSVNDVVGSLDATGWDELVGSLRPQRVQIYLPRFTLEYKKELSDVLKSLGMGVAFVPREADFSRINPGAELYISRVLHKTFVEVDEEGTEAAAVTAVEISLTSAPPTFRADRPFVVAIRERHSGTILFIGKVVSL